MQLHKRTWIIIVVIGVLFVSIIAACGSTASNQEDAPGAWIPHPIGSGWCMATGVPGVKDGTIAQCQYGPVAPGEPGYWQPIGNGTCVAHGITGIHNGTQAPCKEVLPKTPTPSH